MKYFLHLSIVGIVFSINCGMAIDTPTSSRKPQLHDVSKHQQIGEEEIQTPQMGYSSPVFYPDIPDDNIDWSGPVPHVNRNQSACRIATKTCLKGLIGLPAGIISGAVGGVAGLIAAPFCGLAAVNFALWTNAYYNSNHHNPFTLGALATLEPPLYFAYEGGLYGYRYVARCIEWSDKLLYIL